jgi:hypothetical protein
MTNPTPNFTFTKRNPASTALDHLYECHRGAQDKGAASFIGVVGTCKGVWLACTRKGETAEGFKTRLAAAKFLSANTPPTKAEVQAACDALSREMQSPEFIAAFEADPA